MALVTGPHTESVVARVFSVLLLLLAAGAPRAEAQSRVGDCGYDRWPVKVLRDRDAKRVNRDTVQTTIRELNAIPIPEIPYPRDARIAPHELTIYRLSGVVEAIRVEDDRDWHLILSDPEDSSHTMIVEIPDPQCAQGTEYGPLYQSARDSLRPVRYRVAPGNAPNDSLLLAGLPPARGSLVPR